MRTFEVFLKKAGRDEFRHAGSLEAPDPEMAVLLARDSYCRRAEGAEMWLVEREHVLVADEDMLAVTDHQPHRHNDGTAVAARRKALREGAEAEVGGTDVASRGTANSTTVAASTGGDAS